jgi:dihydrofolate synthase/folylpolyglutamate synthase
MTYQETLDYMFRMLPMYQKQGNSAFKKNLTNTLKLLKAAGNPHHRLRCVHIAGTNGKGTSAHSIAAILQSAGYSTGLYTSPHLKDFTERIRVSGIPVTEEFVITFIEKYKSEIESIRPSFFEITVVMAFEYFDQCKVDFAVIEVGLGGRLDSTNVILPLVSLITSIGLDHQDMLGETLTEIAGEKAGIIKNSIPVVIGDQNPDLEAVFNNKEVASKSRISFANKIFKVKALEIYQDGQFIKIIDEEKKIDFNLKVDIMGKYYLENIPGILQTIEVLRQLGLNISDEAVTNGLGNVKGLTGLKGRWQMLQEKPLVIADVGHNIDGIKAIVSQIATVSYRNLYFIIGGVREKKWEDIIPLLPKKCQYIITQPQIPRAIDAEQLAGYFKDFNLDAIIILDVNQALEMCLNKASEDDFIIIGGSTFVVAELNDM